MIKILFLIGGAVLSAFVTGMSETKQRRAAERACACQCVLIRGDWPVLQDALAASMLDGERVVKRYPWFLGGSIVCSTRDDARVRFWILQLEVDRETARWIEEHR